MKKALFIDRDGTILVEPADEQVDSVDKLAFLPGAISALRRIASDLDYELVMVTNQDGLGTGAFPENTFWPAHNLMLRILEGEGVRFSDVLIDRTFPEANAPTRKPGTAMLTRYLSGDYDLARSFVVGDRATDVELAKNLGARAIAVAATAVDGAELATTDWDEIYRYLRDLPRAADAVRETSETRIRVSVTLDGEGRASIATGVGFFDHMLEQIARHARIDLEIAADGDLEVDEHHTVEDTAILLGTALAGALGKKRGIERYSFVLPMDEALAQVALDLSGRGHLEWNVDLARERVGELPTEMVPHFFRTLCNAAAVTLHVDARGQNTHHVIESVFKAFGRCLAGAVARRGGGVPSTKGWL
jgi:imidazoleglycerol-phosphate dehydratase/histidinol-phosphatase